MKQQKTIMQNANIAAQTTESLTHTCWLLAQVTLWPSCMFNPQDIAGAKSLLQKQLTKSGDYYKDYLKVCQRILLTRQRMIDDPGYVISNQPCRFFNSEQAGFKLSEKLYGDLLIQRKTNPLYKLELRGLAESLLEITEDPIAEIFDYWISWFIQQQAYDEQMLFTWFCAYSIFKAKNDA